MDLVNSMEKMLGYANGHQFSFISYEVVILLSVFSLFIPYLGAESSERERAMKIITSKH